MRTAMIALASIALVPFAASGQRQRAEPSFRSATSELVVLPVTVTDEDGALVADLPRERFAVFDDGRPQPIAFSTGQDQPVVVGLIVDSSGSVGPKLGEIVAGALAFARASNPDDEVFVLEFNDTVTDALPGREISAEHLGELERTLTALRPEGRTALYDALLAGLDRMAPGAGSRRVLVLISDGGDNASTGTLRQVMRLARASDVTIYTIGLFGPDDPDANPGVLEEIAKATGGRRFLPKSAGRLLADCRRIAHEIRAGYTLGYVPPDRDGRFHRVRVAVSDEEGRRLTVRTRPGYVAAAPPVSTAK
ncbi:MAG: VWA domain-containing protein [Acidobacteria bacterium]|nr:VWA domain-containing protein [Acidobacteriota bacterium]